MPGGGVFRKNSSYAVKKDGKADIPFKEFVLDKTSERISREDKNDYVGVVGYAGPGVEPGKVFLKKTADIQIKDGDEGQVHGALCREIFGAQPSEIIKAGGCVDGFAHRKGEFRGNSSTLNIAGSYSDGKREVNETAREGITKTIYN